MKKILYLLLVVFSLTVLFSACSVKQEEEIINDSEVENVTEETITEDEKEEEKEEKEEKAPEITENKKEESVKEETKKPDTSSTEVPVASEQVKYELSVKEIMDKMINVIPKDEHSLSEIPSELYKDMYGIDKSKFEDVIVSGSMMSVKSNEIIVIKVKNEEDISSAVKILEERKNQVYKTWEQYLPDQFELVKQAKIKTNGKYAALIIAPYSDKVSEAFMKI